jgi:hypothetical protein
MNFLGCSTCVSNKYKIIKYSSSFTSKVILCALVFSLSVIALVKSKELHNEVIQSVVQIDNKIDDVLFSIKMIPVDISTFVDTVINTLIVKTNNLIHITIRSVIDFSQSQYNILANNYVVTANSLINKLNSIVGYVTNVQTPINSILQAYRSICLFNCLSVPQNLQIQQSIVKTISVPPLNLNIEIPDLKNISITLSPFLFDNDVKFKDLLVPFLDEWFNPFYTFYILLITLSILVLVINILSLSFKLVSNKKLFPKWITVTITYILTSALVYFVVGILFIVVGIYIYSTTNTAYQNIIERFNEIDQTIQTGIISINEKMVGGCLEYNSIVKSEILNINSEIDTRVSQVNLFFGTSFHQALDKVSSETNKILSDLSLPNIPIQNVKIPTIDIKIFQENFLQINSTLCGFIPIELISLTKMFGESLRQITYLPIGITYFLFSVGILNLLLSLITIFKIHIKQKQNS